ncbi:hypothetical protein PQX77_004084 [Marasmius sp. AFHP31]|nr:hypothetical protein PQX77_004084 [Marasmius sp. AFHP31]
MAPQVPSTPGPGGATDPASNPLAGLLPDSFDNTLGALLVGGLAATAFVIETEESAYSLD